MEMTEFQVVPKEDLERAWKSSRRDRLKVQEDRIWEKFCKEQDLVKDICDGNPYEFLESFPETYIRELREIKHSKMKRSQNMIDVGDTNQGLENVPKTSFAQDQHFTSDCMPQDFPEGYPVRVVEQTVEQEPKHKEALNTSDETNIGCENSEGVKSQFGHGDTVCLSKELDSGDDILQNLSGRRETDGKNLSEPNPYNLEFNLELYPTDEMVMMSTGTSVHMPISPPKMKPPEKAEIVSSRLKSSIYCSKFKNIRMKINETLNSIIQSLHSDDVALYLEKLTRIQKCSKEFCNRFTRVYMYQLQQQLQSIKRNNALKLPFGKHTQFQAQMVKMESLHQNILQALQVFHKSFEQTHCIGDSIDLLRNLTQLLRDTLTECAAIVCPDGVAAERDVHCDTILSSCENLNVALVQHTIKMERAVNRTDGFKSNRRGKIFKQQPETSRTKLKMGTSKSVLGSSTGADSRLSMYSFNTSRNNLTPKMKYLKGDPYRSVASIQRKSSRTTLSQHGLGCKKPNNTRISEQDNQDTSQALRKISSKRPLMNDPQRGRPKRRIQKEKDIKTMVEQVDASPARMNKVSKEEHSSRCGSLVHTPTSVTSPKSLSSATTKSTSPRIKKTSKSVGINETRSSDDQMKNTKYERPSPRSDNTKTVQNASTTNIFSPTKCRNEVAEQTASQQQHGKTSARNSIGVKHERVSGACNAQLVVCISDDSSRCTELHLDQVPEPTALEGQRWFKYPEKYRLKLEPNEDTVSRWTQHRARFLQHMLTSHMYTNSSIGQPWHVVGRISEKIIDDILVECAHELQIQDKILQIYQEETC